MTKLDPALIEALSKINPDTLAALARMSPEGLAKVDRDARRNASVRESYEAAAKAQERATTAMLTVPGPKPLADHGHRLSAILPVHVVAFGQGGQRDDRNLSQGEVNLIERAQSEIGAVRGIAEQAVDRTRIARAPHNNMLPAELLLKDWGPAGQAFVFWYQPRLADFKLSDLQRFVLARFVKGGQGAISAAEFDMATEVEAFRRGMRKTDPRREAEIAEAEARLAELVGS